MRKLTVFAIAISLVFAGAGVMWWMLHLGAQHHPPVYETMPELESLAERWWWGEDASLMYNDAQLVVERINDSLKGGGSSASTVVHHTHLAALLAAMLQVSEDDKRHEDLSRMWESLHPLVEGFTRIADAGAIKEHLYPTWTWSIAGERRAMLGRPFLRPLVDPALNAASLAMLVDMRERFENNDHEGVIQAARRAFNLARQRAGLPALPYLLPALGAESNTLSEIRTLALEGMPATTAEALIGLIKHRTRWIPEGVALAFEGERLLTQDEAWWRRFGDPASGAYSPQSSGSASLFTPRFDRVWRSIDAQFEAWTEAVLANPSAGKPLPSRDDLKSITKLRDNFTVHIIESIGYRLRQLTTEEAATIVALRLAAYKERFGGWPSDLTEAMPETEAIDPISGQVFGYEFDSSHGSGTPRLWATGGSSLYFSPGTPDRFTIRPWRELLVRRATLDQDDLDRLPPPEIFDQPPVREILEAGR